jgi:hypothetical protein
MDENNVNAYVWLIDTLAFQGKETEAFEWFIRSLNSRRTDEKIIRAYESAFQTRGWDEVLREQAKRFEETDEVYFRGAGIHAQIEQQGRSVRIPGKILPTPRAVDVLSASPPPCR